MSLLPAIAIAVGFIVFLTLLILQRSRRPRRIAEPGWVATFSADKYRPMERLLNEKDYTFLAAQPGYDPSIARRLRKDRRRIFLNYLASLRSDFYALHGAAMELAATSATDRPELTSRLMHEKAAFQFAVAEVRLRLAFSAVGIGRPSATPLLAVLSRVSQTARQRDLMPSAG